MFLAFWYCSIFPTALLLASAALLINYYTDKFSLMRTWKRAPHVSTEISTYSRHYFFSSSLVFLAGMCSFYWSSYPFDNMCVVGNQTVDARIEGTYTAMIADRFNTAITLKEIEVTAGDNLYKFCEQDYILGTMGVTFPFLKGEWMDEEQHWVAKIFAWTSVGVVIMIATKFLVSGIVGFSKRFAATTYVKEVIIFPIQLPRKASKEFYYTCSSNAVPLQAVGVDQGIDFHDVHNITGFIPQGEE